MQHADYDERHIEGEFKPHIDRQDLRKLIQGKLTCFDRRTIYTMIDLLLALGFIRHNPTSQLSAQKHVKMPSNDTRYFIEVVKCTEFLKTHEHTHTTLDSFNRSSPESQTANKDEIPLSHQPQ